MQRLSCLRENTSGRDFVVGDLHGCYAEFLKHLEAQNFDSSTDRVISVGDLIDRGPDSLKCLKLPDQPWFHCVWGNHEALMLDALSKGPGSSEFRFWMQNGGEWALEYDLDELHRTIVELEKSTPLAIEIRLGEVRVGVIHAEVPHHQWQTLTSNITDPDFKRAIWSRSTIFNALYDIAPLEVAGIDYVISGHTPLKKTFRAANRIYIDTGAGHSRGGLTVANLESLLQYNFHDSKPELFR